MVKVHIRTDEFGRTGICIIKHSSWSGNWSDDTIHPDLQLSRSDDPAKEDEWIPVIEGVRLEPYVTLEHAVSVEVHASMRLSRQETP
jgi:hypothetical protein